MSGKTISPVLKWAGGKTQILEFITKSMPTAYNNYYEPFIGGGAVWLAVAPVQAVINDTNAQLINLYRQLKDNGDAVLAWIHRLDGVQANKEFYYQARDAYNRKIAAQALDAECAALMVWLNKHCFNGLYRVNSKGFFNVPYNNRVGGASVDEDNFAAIVAYLQQADVMMTCQDFEAACHGVRRGDFVYFDSPYIPMSETADFTDYTKDGFSFADHQRLAELFARLDRVGAKLMLSNNDVSLVYELYHGFHIRSFDVKRMINRNASGRKGREVLVTNY